MGKQRPERVQEAMRQEISKIVNSMYSGKLVIRLNLTKSGP